MLDKVRKTITENGLLKHGDRVLVGLSGGADSTALTHALVSLSAELGITVCCAHINHGIRGDLALRDEEFAKKFSEQLNIECYIKRANVKELAKEKGVSEELMGRNVRYAFFGELKEKYKINKIATAHNKNDNAETILMNFMRGTGLAGLSGIPIKRGAIIRPVLEVTRAQIESYCAENNLDYVTDDTNLERVYTRNKIRLDLLPYILENFNGNFINTVTQNAKLLHDDAKYLDERADEYYCGESIAAKKLNELPKAVSSRIVYRMLQNAAGSADLKYGYVCDILNLSKNNKSGHKIDLPSQTEAIIEHGLLTIRKKRDFCGQFEYEIPLGEEIYIKELDMRVRVTEAKMEQGECFEAELPCRICIRNRRAGDMFYPVGMNGRKKIKDYFIDEKISVSERASVGILTIDNNIAWVIGKRRDRRFNFKEKGIKVEYNYCNRDDNVLK